VGGGVKMLNYEGRIKKQYSMSGSNRLISSQFRVIQGNSSQKYLGLAEGGPEQEL
jgi:hypothetical protein